MASKYKKKCYSHVDILQWQRRKCTRLWMPEYKNPLGWQTWLHKNAWHCHSMPSPDDKWTHQTQLRKYLFNIWLYYLYIFSGFLMPWRNLNINKKVSSIESKRLLWQWWDSNPRHFWLVPKTSALDHSATLP